MSKTVDELRSDYNRGFWSVPEADGLQAQQNAGIAAVVRALRDEIDDRFKGEGCDCYDVQNLLNEILGDAGNEKVAEDPLPHLSEREKALFVAALKGDAGPTTPPATAPAPAVCDIKQLVKRLRAEEWATVERERTRNDAADALEAMAAEVQRLNLNGIHSCWEECPRLPCVQGREIRALKAERDRLKAALQDCVDAYDFVIVNEYDRGWSSVSDAIHAARKALGGDAS